MKGKFTTVALLATIMALAIPSTAAAARSLAMVFTASPSNGIDTQRVELGDADNQVCALIGYGEEEKPPNFGFIPIPGGYLTFNTRSAISASFVDYNNGSESGVAVCPPGF